MKPCRCTSTDHSGHPGKPCDKPAATSDQYCQECKWEKEHADTDPEIPSYKPR